MDGRALDVGHDTRDPDARTARGTRPEGLNELPEHVRRLHRVRRHVTPGLPLNAVRIPMNRDALPDLPRE